MIDDYIRRYLAAKLAVRPWAIISFKFSASPSQTWSEHTSEDFSCRINVQLIDGTHKTVFLDEDDVCEFLGDLPSFYEQEAQ